MVLTICRLSAATPSSEPLLAPVVACRFRPPLPGGAEAVRAAPQATHEALRRDDDPHAARAGFEPPPSRDDPNLLEPSPPTPCIPLHPLTSRTPTCLSTQVSPPPHLTGTSAHARTRRELQLQRAEMRVRTQQGSLLRLGDYAEEDFDREFARQPVEHPLWQCPNSAPVPRGAPGGSGRLNTSGGTGAEAAGRLAHCLGSSSSPPPQSPILRGSCPSRRGAPGRRRPSATVGRSGRRARGARSTARPSVFRSEHRRRSRAPERLRPGVLGLAGADEMVEGPLPRTVPVRMVAGEGSPGRSRY